MARVSICGRLLDIVSVLSSMLYRVALENEKTLDGGDITVIRLIDTLSDETASFRCSEQRCCVELDLENRIRTLRAIKYVYE